MGVRMMENLSVYTPGQLQTAAALLRDAQRDGVDVAGLLAIIDAALHPLDYAIRGVPGDQSLLCPACGSRMYQCHQASAMAGVPVYVCSAKCGYSVMAGGK